MSLLVLREKKRPLSFGKSGAGKGVAASLQRREIQVIANGTYIRPMSSHPQQQ